MSRAVVCVSLQASKRLESGEISQDEFLNVAHKIKHFFQYQEEKQQRSDSWDDSTEFSGKKQPLLTKPLSPLPRPHDGMDAAELSYYEHKSKLKKTQVTRHPAGEQWETEESPEESEKTGGSQSTSLKFNRVPLDRPGELRVIWEMGIKYQPELQHVPFIG